MKGVGAPFASRQQTMAPTRLPVFVDPPPPVRLPALHARWVAELLPGPLPAEPHATCGACAMLPPDDAPAEASSLHFDAETRCCTYHPSLPNFLVGRVLRDPGPHPTASSEVLLARIAGRRAVSPLGVAPADNVRARYEAAVNAGAFGRSPDLRCPHLREGEAEGCAIWAHRNATCATWFCKHDRGGRGMALWSRLRELLALAEARLARWCLVALELGDEALARALPEADAPGRRGWAPEEGDVAWAAQWGRWRGREAEFYVACADRVDALGWAEVARVCGADADALARLVRGARAALDDDAPLPTALRFGGGVSARVDAGEAVVHAYSHYDPLVVPGALVDVLRRFDGRPTGVVLAELEGEGVSLDASALRQLVDFEVLVAAP